MAKRPRQRADAPRRTSSRPVPLRTPRKDGTLPAASPTGLRPLFSAPIPSAEAVSLFEEGVRALQRHSYADAAERFRALLVSFPGERAVRDRSQVYLSLCERELKRRPPAPKTTEERLTAATAALNDNRDTEAEKLARAVLGDSPQQDLALYLLAAVEARRGSTDAALGLLGRAIGVSPEVRAQARHDADFARLRHLEAFRQLIDASGNTHGARHARRARGDR